MKTVYALLIAALFTTAACGKKKDEAAKTDPPKTDPATKPTEPAKPDPATPDPAKPDPAKPAEPAAGGSMSVDEAGNKMGALMEKVGAAIKDAGGDCAKMGAALKPLSGEMQAMMKAGEEFDKDEAKKKEFDTKYGDKMMKQMEGWLPAVDKCKDNADVKAFFMALG
jgi:hypothetical protein